MAFGDDYSRIKSGELSGDLCSRCGSFMIIEKRGKKVTDRFGRVKFKIVWSLICQDCRRTIPFNIGPSAYK